MTDLQGQDIVGGTHLAGLYIGGLRWRVVLQSIPDHRGLPEPRWLALLPGFSSSILFIEVGRNLFLMKYHKAYAQCSVQPCRGARAVLARASRIVLHLASMAFQPHPVRPDSVATPSDHTCGHHSLLQSVACIVRVILAEQKWSVYRTRLLASSSSSLSWSNSLWQ